MASIVTHVIKGVGPLCAGTNMAPVGSVAAWWFQAGRVACCPVCGRWIRVKADGGLRQHREPEALEAAAQARKLATVLWRRQRRAERREAREAHW